MDEEAVFESAMLASPFDDTLCLKFADWLDERRDRRGEFIRAWFAIREDSNGFQLAMSRWAKNGDPTDVGYVDNCFVFCDRIMRYEQLARGVDRNWLWRLGAVRPWVDQELGMLIARCVVWEGGLDPGALAEERSPNLERAWMFCYDGPDAPSRMGTEYCPPKDCPSWYLVHKYLGTFVEVGASGPMATMSDMEGRM